MNLSCRRDTSADGITPAPAPIHGIRFAAQAFLLEVVFLSAAFRFAASDTEAIYWNIPFNPLVLIALHGAGRWRTAECRCSELAIPDLTTTS